jgi:cell division protein FtsB
MPAPRHRQRSRPAVWRRSRLWIVVLAGLCLVAYLYYRPVKAYMSASHQLAERKAEVRALTHQKRLLEHRLADSGTGQALLEEARRLGYVRPGERLFVVRGVKEWLAARAAKIDSGH